MFRAKKIWNIELHPKAKSTWLTEARQIENIKQSNNKLCLAINYSRWILTANNDYSECSVWTELCEKVMLLPPIMFPVHLHLLSVNWADKKTPKHCFENLRYAELQCFVVRITKQVLFCETRKGISASAKKIWTIVLSKLRNESDHLSADINVNILENEMKMRKIPRVLPSCFYL